MKNPIRLILSLFLLICPFSVMAQHIDKQFTHPERIRYDANCLYIEGEEHFILSAAFHYFRVPKELWRDRFTKIKEAGFNTVETYVPWNWHERNMPKSIKDFSQFNFEDLKSWLKMAHEEFGLYTIVRPGPFICSEWAGGGYPRWLAKYCPKKLGTSYWLRSNHPTHMAWAEHWYDAVIPIIAEEQLTRKPRGAKGIILLQIENEYIYYGMSSARKKEVLRLLSNNCKKNGIEIPLFTCVTPEVRITDDPVLGQLFDMDNQYVWWNLQESKKRIETLKREQPNAPAFVCELQGGWFSAVGGNLSEDLHLDGRHARGLALMAMAGGATGLNYYMFFGGTNLAGWGTRRMTTSYDYGAAIKENGGVGEKYLAMKGLAEFVRQYEKQIVGSTSESFTTDLSEERATIGVRKAKDGTLFVFILNRNAKVDLEEYIELTLHSGRKYSFYCHLQPYDSKVLVFEPGDTQGTWYPKEQQNIERPTCLPAPIRIDKVQYCNEPFTGKWTKLSPQMSLSDVGVNDCRYSMYRSTFNLSTKDLQKYGLLICKTFTADPLYAEVNGKVLHRVSNNEYDNTFSLGNTLRKGKNEIIAIYENRGHAHGHRPMEELSGMQEAGLGAIQSEIIPIEKWEVRALTMPLNIEAERKQKKGWSPIMLDPSTVANLATLQIAGLEKPKWPAAWILQDKKGDAFYRTQIELTKDMLKKGTTVLEFGCVDDWGTLYVNGRKIGSHNKWNKPFIVDIAPYVKVGSNEVAIHVHNSNGAGGLLKGVRLYSKLKIIKPLKWEVSRDLGGVCEHFHEGKKGDAHWQDLSLNTKCQLSRKGNDIIKTGKYNALLTWYRVTFTMPKNVNDIWVPWRAIINASGTGYLWLNGHNIGRYWEQGPQREFFLPECWLNYGKENTLVMGLRQSEKWGSVLQGIEVLPYYDAAEFR